MITNLIILGLNVPNWLLWVIGGIAVFLLAYKRSSRQIEDDKRIKESIRKDEEEKKKKDLERGYYFLKNVGYSEKKFISTLSQKIVVTLCEKNTKDLLIISSSWPMEMNENDLKNLQRLFPELISVKAINQSQLSLKKSPAADFSSVRENALQHLFSHLNKKYYWLDRDTTVLLETDVFNPKNCLECRLEYRPLCHLALGVMIGNINGIINKDDIIRQMSVNSGSLKIIKKEEKSWDELIPLIKNVFIDYFPKGVKFDINQKEEIEEKNEDNI